MADHPLNRPGTPLGDPLYRPADGRTPERPPAMGRDSGSGASPVLLAAVIVVILGVLGWAIFGGSGMEPTGPAPAIENTAPANTAPAAGSPPNSAAPVETVPAPLPAPDAATPDAAVPAPQPAPAD